MRIMSFSCRQLDLFHLCCQFLLKFETVKYRFMHGLMKINSKYFIFTQIMQSAIRLLPQMSLTHRTAWVIQLKNKFSTRKAMRTADSRHNFQVVLKNAFCWPADSLVNILHAILLQCLHAPWNLFSISGYFSWKNMRERLKNPWFFTNSKRLPRPFSRYDEIVLVHFTTVLVRLHCGFRRLWNKKTRFILIWIEWIILCGNLDTQIHIECEILIYACEFCALFFYRLTKPYASWMNWWV